MVSAHQASQISHISSLRSSLNLSTVGIIRVSSPFYFLFLFLYIWLNLKGLGVGGNGEMFSCSLGLGSAVVFNGCVSFFASMGHAF